MTNSILNTVKKTIGIAEDNYDFDTDIILSINTVFGILRQMGIGPQTTYFTISDETTTWDDFMPVSPNKFAMVKQYIPLKVRLMFDPPQNGNLFESMSEIVKELEYRLYIEPVSVIDEPVVDEEGNVRPYWD